MDDKAVFRKAAVAILLIALAAGAWFASRAYAPSRPSELLSQAYAAWAMDKCEEGVVKDIFGKFNAEAINIGSEKSLWGKALLFNGNNAFIKTLISFKGWKEFTIFFLVKPLRKNSGGISAILDNGHTPGRDFVIQSARINDPDGNAWVFHCNGADILLMLSYGQWSQVVITANTASGVLEGFVNGISAGKKTIKGGFEFGDKPLVFGKLSGYDKRYFRGYIDEVVILNRAITEEEVKKW